MSKIIFFISSLLILVSCDRTETGTEKTVPKDNVTIDTTPILVTNLYNKNYEGSYSINFKYVDNKIIEESYSSGSKKTYSYDGNNIVKYVNTLSNGDVYETCTYNYKNDKLSSKEILKNNGTVKSTYTYNWINENELNCEIVSVWPTCTYYETINYYYSLGNLIKSVSRSSGSGTITTEYEYDNKNNFYKNIVGLNKIFIDDTKSSVNNIIKKSTTQSIYFNGSTSVSNFIDIINYEYNSNDYPLKSILNNNANYYTTYNYNK